MRAIIILAIAAIVATGLSTLFIKSPPTGQSWFRECVRIFFQAYMSVVQAFAGAGRDAPNVEKLTTLEVFLSMWFIAFVPTLFASGYAMHRWWH